MKEIIAIANQKGGVGKTTTAVAMLTGLSMRGYRVLGIDLDPQGNMSDAFGAECYEIPTVYELLKYETIPQDVIQELRGCDIMPSNIMLAGAEQELCQTGNEHRLKEVASSVAENYDYVVIDTPPSLGKLTVNALVFASKAIVPTTSGIYAARGISQLQQTIEIVRRYCNPDVSIEGILMTKYNPRTNVGRHVMELTEQLASHIGSKVFKTSIRAGVAVEEAQAANKDLFEDHKNSNVAKDYSAFIDEYLGKAES